ASHILLSLLSLSFSFFPPTPTPDIYTLSLHDALPISLNAGSSTPAIVITSSFTCIFSARLSSTSTPKSIIAVLNASYSSIRASRSEEHTSELQSRFDLVCRLLLEKKKTNHTSSLQYN